MLCPCSLYPLHGILIVSQVVEAERNSCRCHGRPGDLQEFLNSSLSNELRRKLLMKQQRGEILRREEKKKKRRKTENYEFTTLQFYIFLSFRGTEESNLRLKKLKRVSPRWFLSWKMFPFFFISIHYFGQISLKKQSTSGMIKMF